MLIIKILLLVFSRLVETQETISITQSRHPDIDWTMCGEMACFVPRRCIKDTAQNTSTGDAATFDFEPIESQSEMRHQTCPVGVLIKPFTAHKWFIYVQSRSPDVGIENGGQLLFSCNLEKNEVIGEQKLEKEIIQRNQSNTLFTNTTYYCGMIYQSTGKEIASFLESLSPNSTVVSGSNSYSISTQSIIQPVRKKISCDPTRLQRIIPYFPELIIEKIENPLRQKLGCAQDEAAEQELDQWQLRYVNDTGHAVVGDISCKKRGGADSSSYEYYDEISKRWLTHLSLFVFCARDTCNRCSALPQLQSPPFQHPTIVRPKGRDCDTLYCPSRNMRIDGRNASTMQLAECFSRPNEALGWSIDGGKSFIEQIECVQHVNCQDSAPIAIHGLEPTPVRSWNSTLECPAEYTMRRSHNEKQAKLAIARLECDSLSGKWVEVQLDETVKMFDATHLLCTKIVELDQDSPILDTIAFISLGLLAFFLVFAIFICCISCCCESILPDAIARLFRTTRIFIYRNTPIRCQSVEGYQEDVENNEMIPDSEMNFVGPLISRTYTSAEYQHRYAEDTDKAKVVDKIKFNKDLNEVVDIGIGSQRGNEIFIDEKKSSKSSKSKKATAAGGGGGSDRSEQHSLLHGYNVDVAEFLKEHAATKKEFEEEDRARERNA